MHERRHLYINGNWVELSGEGSIEVINPTNEEVIGSVPVSSDSDANLQRLLGQHSRIVNKRG